MENFEQNQNTEIEEQDEFSTVFSDPTAHKMTADQTKNPNKKRLTAIIAGVLAVAVLIGGTIAVIKLMPEMKENEDTTSQIPQITVMSMKETEFKSIKVVNKNGNFMLDNKVSKDEDGYDECVWTLQGYDMDVISDSALYNIASNFMSLTALREISTKTVEECGLDKPVAEIVITKQDDSVVTVLVGKQSPDGAGAYVKLADKDTIYLIAGDFDTRLSFEALDLANTDGIEALTFSSGYEEYLSNGLIASFDSLTISGKNFSKPVIIKPNTDKTTSELHNYVITSPTKRMAENVDKALLIFNDTTTVSGAYSLDSKAATIKKLGLDKPDLTIAVKLGKTTYTYKFKLQEDGGYAVWYDGCKMIKKISADALEVLSYSTNNFYSTWIYLQSIDQLSGFVIKSEGKEYRFDINVKVNEESKNEYTIKYDGKKLTASNFQDFYRYCISLYASDFDTTKVTSEVEYEITYIYSDTKRAPTKITFQRSSATKYLFSVDGEAIGHVNASDINRISTYVKQVIKDEKVNII